MLPSSLDIALDVAPVGFAVVEGPSMTFTRANPRYLEMVSRTDIVGKRWADVFPELVGSPTEEAVLAAQGGQRVEVSEFSVAIERDGVPREGFFSFSLDPMRDASGACVGFVVLAVEVTELVVRRREAEELAARLHEREARHRMLFEAVDEGFCILEMIFDADENPVDYRFLEVNDAFLRHTGLPPPVGKTARELVPDLDESWFRLYGAVAKTGEPARFENNAPAMNRWFDVFAGRIGDPTLHHVGLVFKDVSARKRAELEKEQLLASEREARLEAERANRLKDEFLATVSHELRTPLNAMLGWLSLVRSGRIAVEKHAHALETIERNARAQAQLVEDLLDVSRILGGKLRLEVEPIDFASVVHAAVDAMKPAAESRRLRLSSTVAQPATVMGDAHRLQQVVGNLISNALKFTNAGGSVRVVLEQSESSLVLSVSDTGIGLAPEFLPLVFDRFRQVDGGTTRSQGGLGLGLSIVRQLVELHGGTVRATSEGLGHGATFVVVLPVALGRTMKVDQGVLGSLGIPCPPELDGIHVLAVDDEKDSREMLAGLLETCGARVTPAASAEEAFARLRDERPTLIVSDIGMPGESGLSLIARIRALPAREGGDVPAVALTAYARAEDRTRCLLAGFDSHVPKPVEPIELAAVVASLVRKKL